jgi:hypothetical protein
LKIVRFERGYEDAALKPAAMSARRDEKQESLRQKKKAGCT